MYGEARKKIFVVDDHPMVRRGVVTLIAEEHDLDVCGEADNAYDALRGIEETKPDLALIDLSLKDSSGLELIKDLQIRCPDVGILVLSMRDKDIYAERALRAGARGYVSKDEGWPALLSGIRNILAGQIYVSEAVAGTLMKKLVGGSSRKVAAPIDDLTDRELEVFELIGTGESTRDIARKLHISTKTVDSHREHIKGKLHLRSGADLVKHAIEWTHSQHVV